MRADITIIIQIIIAIINLYMSASKDKNTAHSEICMLNTLYQTIA